MRKAFKLLSSPLTKLTFESIDNLYKTKEEAETCIELSKLEQDEQLREVQIQLFRILVDAKLRDSRMLRACSSFLYVIYTFILTAIPMGVLFAFQPETAARIAGGAQSWLSVMPDIRGLGLVWRRLSGLYFGQIL